MDFVQLHGFRLLDELKVDEDAFTLATCGGDIFEADILLLLFRCDCLLFPCERLFVLIRVFVETVFKIS